MGSPWSNRLTKFARLRTLSSGYRFVSFLPLRPQKLFVMSLGLSHLDYCNSLLAAISQKTVNKMQRAMNCATHLACKAPRREHVFVDLHWLPAERRTEYTIATTCYSVITCTAPYLSDPLKLYIPSRTLRSSADNRVINSYCKSDARNFKGNPPCHSLVLEQSLFLARHAHTFSSFKSQLRTRLFSVSYS